jgi:hypothetical protein
MFSVELSLLNTLLDLDLMTLIDSLQRKNSELRNKQSLMRKWQLLKRKRRRTLWTLILILKKSMVKNKALM